MGTQRTKEELDALFADNNVGDITPARMRDLIETMKPSRIGLHFNTPGIATTIAVAGTYVKAAGTTYSDAEYRWTMPTNNRLMYNGPANQSILFVATISFTCSSNNQQIAFACAKNGNVQTSSVIRTGISTGSDIRALTLVTDGQFDAGEYLEIWLTNLTGTASVTVVEAHCRLVGFLN